MKSSPGGPQVRPIRCREELEQALALVHDNYVRLGYMAADPSGMRISRYHAHPRTQTFATLVDGHVVATVAMFHDSPLGLPGDAIFRDNLDALRQDRRHLIEVGMLADRRHALKRRSAALLEMMRLVFWAAREEGVDDILATVNPRHERFYRRTLAFAPVGDVRDHPAVGGAPAVLLRLELKGLGPERARRPEVGEMFFTPPQEDTGHPPYRMRREDLRRLFVEQSAVFASLPPANREAVEACYPGLDIEEMLRQSPVPTQGA